MQLRQSKVNYTGLYRLSATNELVTAKMALNTVMVSSCNNAKVTIATKPNIDLHCYYKLQNPTSESTFLSAS